MTARSTDEAAILAVIETARKAFSAGDFATYAAQFVKSSHTAWWTASPVSGTYVRQGWDESVTSLRELMQARAMGERGSDKGIVENLIIHASGDMAWVTFTRRYPDVPEHRVGPNPAHQLRILEKHDGHWKIALVGFLDPSMGQPKSAVLRLDATGRVIWISAAAELALVEHTELTIRNGRVHARDSRLNQRLQASIRWAAKLEQRFLVGRGAVPLVIEAGEGVPARVWWVISDGGAILLALENSDGSARQFEAATAVYGLSPAQRTVAAHIVAGHSIEEIAALTEVKRSTTRTHLDRIFDKTGVRDRAALVRLLLSTMAPF